MNEGDRQRVSPWSRQLFVEHDLTGVSFVDAGEDFDKRRLARPVLPEQGVNLSATDLKVDVIERERPRETLDETRYLEERPGAVLGTNVINKIHGGISAAADGRARQVRGADPDGLRKAYFTRQISR